ncbi:MAG: hypothetical protein M1831_001377 [Alyxoria varia]|nr:MAG: hypothetical protein M1831_001377 [Alyxoria varia]
MSHRPAKRARQTSLEHDQDSEGTDDWLDQAVTMNGRSYTTAQNQQTSPPSPTDRPSRSRRSAAPTSQEQSTTSPPSKAAAATSSSKESNSDLSRRSIKLSLKPPPSRLREITDSSPEAEESSTRSARTGRSAKNKAQPQQPQKGRERPSRAAKGKKAVVDSPSEDEADEEGEEDVEGEPEDDKVNEDEEEDAEGDEEEDEEELDADGDVDMPDAAVAPPSIKVSRVKDDRKPSPSRALRQSGSKVKSVEEKEMSGVSDEEEAPEEDDEEPEDEDDEDEVDDEEEDDEEAEAEKLAILNRNRGIADGNPTSKPTTSSNSKSKQKAIPTTTTASAADIYDSASLPILDDRADDIIQAEDVGSDELDSDPSGDEEASTSRGGTPSAHDASKLTRRQRGTAYEGELMALSNEAQKKKFFTADELNLRRAEMARRRKDLSEKRDKAEKEDTLNRLLNKQPPKRKSKKELAEEREAAEFAGAGRSKLGIVTNAGSDEEEDGATPAVEEPVVEVDGRMGNPYMPPNRVCVRTVVGVGGTRVGVPQDWLVDGQPAGRLFRKGRDGAAVGKENKPADDMMKGRMVMEVDD